jgi:carboxyl-terminal processing protease
MKKIVLVLLFAATSVSLSCTKDPLTGDARINSWIYANMDLYYYWTDGMPKKSGLNRYPADFFESLLSVHDRFSFIYPDYQELLDLLNGISVESGFEFKLYLESESGPNVIMQLTYIKPDSPASTLELQRGDIIYQINGTQLTTDNYRSLLGQMNTTYMATYRRYNPDTEEFQNQPGVSITPVVYAENPIYLRKIIENGGKKVGYLIYNFFSPGTNKAYDNALDAVFAGFQSDGIDELIIDLRFNTGGSVSSAINLASLLPDGVSGNDVAIRYSYNAALTDYILGTPDLGIAFLVDNFLEKTQNVGSMLPGKVYFIVTDRTASASEMVINAIRPYMDVFLVGETTVGKDVGSTTIAEENNLSNNWALQPIIVKLTNSQSQGYPNGFVPDIDLPDDFLVLTPLGDETEPLLNAALQAIGGVPVRVAKPQAMSRRAIFSSVDRKRWNQKMLLEMPEQMRPVPVED